MDVYLWPESVDGGRRRLQDCHGCFWSDETTREFCADLYIMYCSVALSTIFGSFSLVFQPDIQRLQSVLNTAVRLVAGSLRRDHVTSLLRDRHWLPVKQRIEYKLCTMVHRCLCRCIYLANLITTSAAATFKRQLKTFLFDNAFNWHC